MKTLFETANVFVLGENVDTDLIIPARYLLTTDAWELGRNCLEDLIENLADKTDGNGVIVAGRNFGSGSSREHAPIALLGAGVRCVIAPSFARIFFRNAFNVGLPLLTCPDIEGQIKNNDRLSVDIKTGKVDCPDKGVSFQADPVDAFMIELLEAGGLIRYVAAQLIEQGER